MNCRLPKSLFLSLVVAFTCPLAIGAVEMKDAFENPVTQHEKIYVSPEQIVLTPGAIFFLSSEGTLNQASLLSADAEGIFVIAAYYQCPACGHWNNKNKCGNNKCSMYGR